MIQLAVLAVRDLQFCQRYWKLIIQWFHWGQRGAWVILLLWSSSRSSGAFWERKEPGPPQRFRQQPQIA